MGPTLRAVAVVLGSALAYGAAFPPLELAPLASVAYAPVLALVVTTPRAEAARLAGLGFGILAYGLPLRWFIAIFDGAALALFVVFGLLHAIAFQLVWWLAARRGRGFALATAPVVLVGLENFRSEHWPLRFGWATPGYAQASDANVAQAAELVGVYGLSLLAYAAASAWAWALVSTQQRPAARGFALGAPVLLWIALAAWGAGRRHDPALASGAPLRVALVQYETNDVADAMRLAAGLGDDVELAVFPELGAALVDGAPARLETPALDARLMGLARAARATIAMGAPASVPGAGSGEFFNALALFDEHGEALATYHKAEPVPLFVDGRRSGPSGPRETPLGVLGLLICYDLTHPHVALSTLTRAHLAVVASGDLASWTELQHVEHARIATLRAIEHRTWIVRATSSGISQIIAPSGAEIATLPFDEVGVLEGEVRLRDERTPYERVGLLPAYACLLATVMLLGLGAADALRRRRR